MKKKNNNLVWWIIAIIIIVIVLGIIYARFTGYAVASSNFNLICVYDKTQTEGPNKTSIDIYQKIDLNLLNTKTGRQAYKRPFSDVCARKKIGTIYKNFVKEAYCIKRSTSSGRRDSVTYKNPREWTLCEDGCQNGTCIKLCISKTCSDYPEQCGSFSDGCDGEITCSCPSGQSCNNGNCIA